MGASGGAGDGKGEDCGGVVEGEEGLPEALAARGDDRRGGSGEEVLDEGARDEGHVAREGERPARTRATQQSNQTAERADTRGLVGDALEGERGVGRVMAHEDYRQPEVLEQPAP